jgi:lipid A 3-O-deacylase
VRFASFRVAAITVVLLLLAPACAGAAADRAQDRDATFVTLTGDNDFFAGYDHHYTNGIQLAVAADRLRLPALVRALPPLRDGADPHITLSFGQRIYTPTDKTRAEPDPLDRPYGGWLYALAEARVRSGAAVDSVQASLGVIGPASFARQTQNAYHTLIGSDKARGWNAQLDNQPALLLGYERAWPGIWHSQVAGLRADVTPKIGATVGNVYTYVNTGAIVRIGQHLPDDFPVTDISLGPPRDGYRPADDGFGWYVWLGTDARLVAWNTFLDGNLFGGGPSVKRNVRGQDLQLGFATVWKRARLGFTFVRRSREFATQNGADQFGQITLSFAF